MSGAFALIGPTLRSRRRRLLALVAFAALFLAAAATAAVLGRDAHGHVDFNRIFVLGGYPLASGLLLSGWLLGRFPLIATLVLMAGVVSHDRAAGHARLFAVRPSSPLGVYGARFAALSALAFAISAVLMPIFDLIMLGEWAGPATLVLITAYVIAYGGLVAFLSVWIRGDVWVALLLAVVALVWDAALQAGQIALVPMLADAITLVLPPQHALFELENAFGEMRPIPWDAFARAVGYGAVLLALAGISLARRDV